MPCKGDKGDKNAARPPEGSLVETRCLIKGPKSAIVPFPGPRSGPKSRTGPGALAGGSCITWTFNETLGEKTRWEPHKDVMYSFEQILEVAPYKTTAIRLPPSYLTNDPIKTSKTCWELLRSKDERSSMDSNTWKHLQKLIYISCVDIIQSKVPARRNRREVRMAKRVSTTWWWS